MAARKKSRADWQVNSTHISVQALNEFVAVCKKCGKDRETAYQLADAIANARTVHEITLSTYRLAQALATRYQLSHWVGLIVAAATLAHVKRSTAKTCNTSR